MYDGAAVGKPRAREVWESTARRLDLMREVKAQVHASGRRDGESGLAAWRDGEVPEGGHDAMAVAGLQLLHHGEVALRALNEHDVHTLQQGMGLRAKAPGSQSTPREVVELGTRLRISPYVHVTWRPLVALWFAESKVARSGGSPRRIVAIDVRKMRARLQAEGRELVDIATKEGRRGGGIPEGSKGEAYAAWALEALVWGSVRQEEVIAFEGGVYLDTAPLMKVGCEATKMYDESGLLSCMTAAGQARMASFWENAYRRSTAGSERLAAGTAQAHGSVQSARQDFLHRPSGPQR